MSNKAKGLVLTALLGVAVSLSGQANSGKKDKAIQVTVRAQLDGLSPSRLELEEGDYVFLLRNGVYKSALTLVVDDDKAVKLAEKPGRIHSGRTEVEISLKPGRHILRVAENPKMKTEVFVSIKK